MYGTAWLTQGVSVAVIVIGVYLINERQLTMGALIAASMLAGRALAPAGQVVGLLMQYQGARTALESLDKLMAQPVERPSAAEGAAPFIQRRELKGEIELRGVRFAYPNRDDAALDGVSFRVTPGERVALIGRVGSGKSTIQRLVLGLYEPTAGEVLLDGVDVRQLDPADVRRNIAYVSQDVLLFHGSLRDNIAFGLPFADDAAIVAAAEVVGRPATGRRDRPRRAAQRAAAPARRAQQRNGFLDRSACHAAPRRLRAGQDGVAGDAPHVAIEPGRSRDRDRQRARDGRRPARTHHASAAKRAHLQGCMRI
jgi:ATP-binding cassette subfamily C protein LapB